MKVRGRSFRSWARVLRAFVMALTLVHASDAHARMEPVVFEVAATEFVIDAADGMGGFADAAREVIEADWHRVMAASGAPDGETVFVMLEREFDDYFEREGLASRPPEWAAGLAIPSRRVIILAPGNSTWQATLSHEMSHIAVAIAAGDEQVPAWFQEGFAVAVAEQWSIERASTMIQAGVTGAFLDFDELANGFPSQNGGVGLAYAQSFHFVRFARNRYGDDVFARVMRRMRVDGLSFSRAFAEEAGTLLSFAMDEWESSARTRFVFAPVATGGGAAWGLASVLAVWVWRRRKKRQAARLQAMSNEEAALYVPDPDDEKFR